MLQTHRSLNFPFRQSYFHLHQKNHQPEKENICDRQKLIEQAILSWYDLAYSLPTIAFTISVIHAEHMAEAFNHHGVTAAAVTGKNPVCQRMKLYEDVELFCAESSKSSTKGFAPLKPCPRDRGGCGAYVYAVYLKCPDCGFNFEVEKLVTVLGKSQLIRTQDEPIISFYRHKLREAYYGALAPPWAAYQVKDKYGFMPPFDWGRGAIFNHQMDEVETYRQHLIQIANKRNKDSHWIELFMLLKFGKQAL